MSFFIAAKVLPTFNAFGWQHVKLGQHSEDWRPAEYQETHSKNIFCRTLSNSCSWQTLVLLHMT